MANPKWMNASPKYVSHPGSTLRAASKAVAASAKSYKRDNNKDGYLATMFISGALAEVANGKTWAEAFGISTAMSTPNKGESK